MIMSLSCMISIHLAALFADSFVLLQKSDRVNGVPDLNISVLQNMAITSLNGF